MTETNDKIQTAKKVAKVGTAFGTGVILGEVATAFLPGGAWLIIKGIAYLSSVVLSDMLAEKTDEFLDRKIDSFVEELSAEEE